MSKKPLWLARAREVANRFRAEAPKEKPRALFAKNEAGTRGSLYIYEQIGEDWWTGGGVTAKGVVEALDAMKGVAALDVFINSEGGDVFEAKAIYANLRRFDTGERVVHVDGIAASAATFIAMAGDKVITAPAATWMIHKAWTIALGNEEELGAVAEILKLEDRAIAETYARKGKKSADEYLGLMAAETWMNAEQALELGLTDEISADDDQEDGDEGETTAAKASPAVAAAARTQQLVRDFRQRAARAELDRIKTKSDRASPAEAHRQR